MVYLVEGKYEMIGSFFCLVLASGAIIVLSSCGDMSKEKSGAGKPAVSAEAHKEYSYPDYSTPENVVKTLFESWCKGHVNIGIKCCGNEYDEEVYKRELNGQGNPEYMVLDSYKILEGSLQNEDATRFVFNVETVGDGGDKMMRVRVGKVGDVEYVISNVEYVGK
ncbi:hypothetical protein J4209_05775 [Candidatus Woesearchaeota archaeon]|nr:hypothetical protein [Candidatus Woesearchaeota archaeon]